MTLSSSLLMYEDVQQVMDRALEAEIGLSVQFDKVGDAVHFRQRCYKFRALMRKEALLLPIEDPGRVSIYDSIVVYIRKTIVEIRKRDTVQYNIRELKA